MKNHAQMHKEKSKNHFEKISLHHSDTYAARYTEPMHDALIQELDGRDFATLLEVGCGTGTFLSMILNKFNVKVSGFDISPGMIEESMELLGDRADLNFTYWNTVASWILGDGESGAKVRYMFHADFLNAPIPDGA
jgi:SAM-dependent methyltransferase